MDGADLRDRLATGRPVLMPGVWDALRADPVLKVEIIDAPY